MGEVGVVCCTFLVGLGDVGVKGSLSEDSTVSVDESGLG